MAGWLVLAAAIAGLVYVVRQQGGLAQLSSDAGGLVTDLEGSFVSGTTDGGALGQAVDLIAGFEGFSAHAYNDPPGSDTWSIGYGHQIRPGDPYDQTSVIGETEARQLLQQDVTRAYSAVQNAVQVQLSDNQIAALVSFAYNVGLEAFDNSTLLRDLNAGNYQAAADQFPLWIHAGGQVSADLEARRSQEQSLFEQDIPGEVTA